MIHQHVSYIPPNTLKAIVENAAILLSLLSKNDGRHIKHALYHVSEVIKHILNQYLHVLFRSTAPLPP